MLSWLFLLLLLLLLQERRNVASKRRKQIAFARAADPKGKKKRQKKTKKFPLAPHSPPATPAASSSSWLWLAGAGLASCAIHRRNDAEPPTTGSADTAGSS